MAHEEGIVENLVTQFSSAFDCLRELVQNSIDAGSPQVDVWMEFERGEQTHQGVIAIHVDDFGEGMDEYIIDNQLTTLFASAKEGDLTKIGKFGIGFVSVFALKPKGVLLHTGRAGEFWEVFFHEDRSFSKTSLDFPVEGTQITLFLEGDYRRYKEFVREVRSTLSHWCQHSETEISFEDRSPLEGTYPEIESINSPFDVPGDCPVRVTHQGTEMVIAYSSSPHYGFYNRGLALAYSRHGEDVLFERAGRYRQIAFKIKSRYLEHTLSRETIMRDVNYEKAMLLLDEAVAQQLLPALLTELAELAKLEHWRHEDARRYIHLFEILVAEPRDLQLLASQAPIFRTLHGRPISPEQAFELWERDGRLLFAQEPSTLTQRLDTMGIPIFYGAANATHEAFTAPRDLFDLYASTLLAGRITNKVVGLLKQVGFNLQDAQTTMRRSLTSPEQAFLPVSIEEKTSPELHELLKRVDAMLQDIKADYSRLALCRMNAYVEDAPLFVIAPEIGSFMARPPHQSKRRGKMHVAINQDHALFKQIVHVATQQGRQDLAVYMLAKGLLLQEDRLLEKDVLLISRVLDRVA